MAVKGDTGHGRRTQAERRAGTRAALLAAGRELFATKGFAGAGREEIVERAGVTRGAMYHHFASKEALFQAVYEAVEEEVLGRVVAAAGAFDGDERGMLRAGCLAYLDVAAAEDVRRICLIDAPAVLPTEVRRELSERHGLGVIRETLRACMAEGSVTVQPLDPLAHLLLAMLLEAATLVAEGRDHDEVATVFDHFLERL